jgi:hypothetical protein
MRRLALISLFAVLAGSGTAGAASADTPRCVSRHEYNRVVKGMTMTKVHKIFDIEGTLTGLGKPNELRYYDTCTGRGVVQVVYTPRGRVVSKNARFF